MPKCRSSEKERVILKWPHDYDELSAVLAEIRWVEAGVCRGAHPGEKVLKVSENWPQSEVRGDEDHTLVVATTTPIPPPRAHALGRGREVRWSSGPGRQQQGVLDNPPLGGKDGGPVLPGTRDEEQEVSKGQRRSPASPTPVTGIWWPGWSWQENHPGKGRAPMLTAVVIFSVNIVPGKGDGGGGHSDFPGAMASGNP